MNIGGTEETRKSKNPSLQTDRRFQSRKNSTCGVDWCVVGDSFVKERERWEEEVTHTIGSEELQTLSPRLCPKTFRCLVYQKLLT